MKKSFFIRLDGKHIKVNLQDIVYIEAYQNYLKMVLPDKIYLVHLTMKRIEAELPAGLFYRIHRSYIVALDKVMAFQKDKVYLPAGIVLPVSEAYKNDLRNQFWIIDNETAIPQPSFIPLKYFLTDTHA